MKTITQKIMMAAIVVAGSISANAQTLPLDQSGAFSTYGVSTGTSTASFVNDGSNVHTFTLASGTNNHRKNYKNRAVLVSDNAYTSATGFNLEVTYKIAATTSTGGSRFSFGLVSDDTDYSTGLDYTIAAGQDPYSQLDTVYSIGVNVGTIDALQGLTFTNGTSDTAGTRTHLSATSDFVGGSVACKVGLTIDSNAAWALTIDDVAKASGTIAGGFDLTKAYKFVAYAQDDNNAPKVIEAISLKAGVLLSNDEINAENGINVLQNPVGDVLKTSIVSNNTVIYNLQGSVVKSFNAEASAFDVSDLESGIYFVKFTFGNSIETRKIIKE